jgi:hypothetical protein
MWEIIRDAASKLVKQEGFAASKFPKKKNKTPLLRG